MRIMTHFRFLFVCLFLMIAVRSWADPVADFVTEADALSNGGDAAGLSGLVEARPLLVGAAVGQLLDAAFAVSGTSEQDEADTVALARRIAELHASVSTVPLASVERYLSWTPEQRATKRRAIALEDAAVEARGAGDPDKAVSLLEEAQELYVSIDDLRAQAVNWGSQGVAHWYRGDWEAVERSYALALAARREIEDRILEGRTLNGQGSARLQQGDLEGALAGYQRAIALRQRTGDRVGLATSLNYAGNVYIQSGKLVEARRLFERARPVLEAEGNAQRLVELSSSIGNLYAEMGRYADAARAYGQALERIDAAPEYEVTIRLNLASSLREQGRLREAQETIASLVANTPIEELPIEISYSLQRERGLVELQLGEIDAARSDLRLADSTARSMDNPLLEVEAAINRAALEIQVPDYALALAIADSAAERSERIDAPTSYRAAQQVAIVALEAMGDYAESLRRIDSLLEADREAQRHPSALAGLIARGNALTSLERSSEARDAFREALREIERLGVVVQRWVPLLGIGDSFETEAPDSARIYYERSFEAFESARAEAGSGAVRTGYLNTDRGRVFEEVVAFFGAQQQRDPGGGWSNTGFALTERARARGLLELLQQSFSADSDSVMSEALDALYALGEPDPADHEERRQLNDLIASRWDEYLRGAAPAVARFTLVEDLDDVSRALEEDTTALVYSIGKENSWLWVIDRDGHELVELPPRERIRTEVLALREALALPGFGDRQLERRARKLYDMLVAPAASRLGKGRQLRIVPDDILFELPFEMLLSEKCDRNWRKAKYLGRKHPIAYAPSVSVLLRLRDLPPVAHGGGVLAVGDPQFSAESGLVGLPETRNEIAAIEKIARGHSHSLQRAAATESGVRAAMAVAAPPRLLHFATHGLVDREDPSLSCIALASETGGDGYLYTLEILSMPLDTELVVLSACETGRGKLERGEGSVGLTRSFLAAGARRVVASLWPVADASTATWMEEFYKQLLQKGRPVDESMRRARAKLWKDKRTAHPYYWAPFVLMGSDRPLPPITRG